MKVFMAYGAMVVTGVMLIGVFLWVISVASCYRQSVAKQVAFDWNMTEGCALK